MRTKILFLLIVIGYTCNAQHNYDAQSIIYSNNGNVGIGTSNPTSGLEVNKKTFKLSNNYPEYNWIWGGGTDLNWYTIIEINFADQTYRAASFDITIKNAGTNYGGSVMCEKLQYHVSARRSHSVANGYDDGLVSGPIPDYVRLVKISQGNYEIQVRQSQNWRHMSVKAQISSHLGINATYLDTPVLGQSGTVYMPQNLHYDYHTNSYFSGNVGIGTTNPAKLLTVSSGSNVYMRIQKPQFLDYFDFGITTHSGIISYKAGTSTLSNIIFQTNDINRLQISHNGNIGIGTTNPTEKLAVNGTIKAKEVKVETNWPDFVFEEDYNLQPLSEVETFIKKNKHLPDIPSEAEVKENGISVGEMNAKLLQKIEELMLHTINQQKLIENQQKRIDALEKKDSQ